MGKIRIFIESLFIQTLMNRDDMQRYGYRMLTKGEFDEHINSNPHFSSIIAGILHKNPSAGLKIRFVASISAMLGDDLFWNLLKPITVLFAIILLLFTRNILIIFIPLIIYNLIVFAIKYFGFDYGIRMSEDIRNLYKEWYFKKMPNILGRAKYFIIGIMTILLSFILIKYLQKHILYAIIICLIGLISVVLKSRSIFLLMILQLILNIIRI